MKRIIKIVIKLILGFIIVIGIINKTSLDNKTQKFSVEGYPIEVELNSGYTVIDKKGEYDFYATDNDNKYLGVFVYNSDEYDSFSLGNVLKSTISFLERTREEIEIVKDIDITNDNDKTITTIVYSGIKGNSARTIYILSTISFNKTEKYSVMILQTCKAINYDKYRNEMMENLKNIRLTDELI